MLKEDHGDVGAVVITERMKARPAKTFADVLCGSDSFAVI